MVTEISKDVRIRGFTPDDLLGEKVPSVPMLASFIRLLVSREDCCNEAESVECRSWVFSSPGGGLGSLLMAGSWPELGVLHYLEGMELWRPHVHPSMVTWFLSSRQPMLLVSCVWFQSDEILNENMIYFNNKISKLDLIETSRILHQQLQNTLLSFQWPMEHFHKLFCTWPWNKLQRIFSIVTWLWLC